MTKMERRLLLGVAAGLAALAVLVAFAYARSLTASDNATRAVHSAKHASSTALKAVHAVQRNRLDLITRSCHAQNHHRRHTIALLNTEIALLPLKERRRAKANKQFTIGLINTLAPKQKCGQLVAGARIHH